MSNYVKARYEGNKRSYCFAAEEDLKPGDEAVTPNGTKVTVVDEPVDLSWIEAYGRSNIKVIKRAPEINEAECKNCTSCCNNKAKTK
jgi:hypothetical protein